MPVASTTSQTVLLALVETLRAQLDVTLSSASNARAEATSEQAKSEGKYDTRSIEAGYLAGAQARRVQEAQTALKRYLTIASTGVDGQEPVAGPCAVVLEREGEERRYFLGPAAGGLRFEADGHAYTVITPASPIGRGLIGAEEGDEVMGMELVAVLP